MSRSIPAGNVAGPPDGPSRFAEEARAARAELGISRFEGSPLQRRLHIVEALESIGRHDSTSRW